MINLVNLTKGRYDLNGECISHNIVIENDGVVLFGGEIYGNVTIKAADTVIEDCKICGEVVFDGARSSIIAKCSVDGEIAVKNSHNCVVLLNNAKSVTASGNTNLYAVENTLSGALTLEGNNYLLADENKCATVTAQGNENYNGDNITDVNARLDCGADETLLPHPNKELFVGAEMREFVLSPSSLENESISEYITRCAKGGNTVILPPGAYLSPEPINLGESASGARIYAYGALQHMLPYGRHINFENTQDIELRGLTTSYEGQICGQITIAEEIDDRTYIAVSYAGGKPGFGKSDPDLYNTNGTDIFEKGEIYPWDLLLDHYDIEMIGERKYKLTLHDYSHSKGKIHKGDRITCRLSGANKSAIMIANSSRILFKDTTLYSHSACLAAVAHGEGEGVEFYRFYDGREAGRIIDRETYCFYRAIEDEYGIEGEVYIDKMGRFRSQMPLICSADGLHIIGTDQGINLTSCLFDGLCDDGSNQHATSSRLAGVTDNGDGTSTLFYKGNVSRIYCINHFSEKEGYGSPGHCYTFKKGDRMLAYNGDGVTFCDTICLSDSEDVEIYTFTLTPDKCPPRHYRDILRRVTVKTADLNPAAIEGYDLSDNNFEKDNKVTVDNLSRNAANYTLDNVVIQNGRSRGVLIKTVGAELKNCTFHNMAHAGILLSAEIAWGESSVSQDTVIKNCLFDHVGYIERYYIKKTAPISVTGLSSRVSEDSLLYKNILIEGNRFTNIEHDYMIAVNSALNVRIVNNIFEDRINESEKSTPAVIDIDTSMNIELSGNKYPQSIKKPNDIVTAINYKQVYGSDITLEDDIK